MKTRLSKFVKNLTSINTFPARNLYKFAIACIGMLASGTIFGQTTVTEIITSGTTWTVPCGVSTVDIEIYGAGGGGGGSNTGGDTGGGGGSGGYRGADYDKAGGESAGPGGASGAYISDMVFNVTGGETLTINVGSGGAAGTGTYSGNSGTGGDTSISGTSSGSLFTLGGGGAA